MLARAVVSTATRRVELREIEIGAVGAVSRQRPRAGRGGLAGCYEAASLAGGNGEVAPVLLHAAAADLQELRRLVAHAVGVRDPVGQRALLDHVDPVHRPVERVAAHHVRRCRRNRTRGGVLVYVAVRGQLLGFEGDDVRHVTPNIGSSSSAVSRCRIRRG